MKERDNQTANDHQLHAEEAAAVGEVLFDTPKRFPTLVDILVLMGLFILSSIVGGLGVRLCGCELPIVTEGVTRYPETWGWSLFVSYLFQMSFMVGATLLYRRLRHGPCTPIHLSAGGLNPLVLCWGLLLMCALSVVIEPLLGLIPDHLSPTPEMGHGIWPLLSAVVLAPLFEELLCRGILLESLRARYGVVTAWIGSSLFFAVMHIQPVMMLNAFILGLLFAYLYLRFRSLWPSLLLHAFNNGLALLMMWTDMPGESFEGRAMAELSLREIVGSVEIYLLVYALALVITLWSGWRMLVHIGRLKQEEKKNRTSEKIISEENSLNSGKKG